MKLQNFDTIIFDLDGTLWDGQHDQYWAKFLKPSIKISDDFVFGSDGGYIRYQKDVRAMFNILCASGKNLGFITLGGLQRVEYIDQPAVIALHLYGIHHFFNHQKTVLFKTADKSDFFIEKGKTCFIDDSQNNLLSIGKKFPNSKTVDRASFKNWSDIL
jgi:predicted phosphatase